VFATSWRALRNSLLTAEMKMTGRGVISKLGPLDVNGSPTVPATSRGIHQISRVARFAIGNPCPPGLAHVPRSTAPLSASRRLHLQPLKNLPRFLPLSAYVSRRRDENSHWLHCHI